MTAWPSAKAKRVYAALLRIGWRLKRETSGSHRVLERSEWPDFVFAFHDIGHLGKLDRVFGVPATTRGWNTILTPAETLRTG